MDGCGRASAERDLPRDGLIGVSAFGVRIESLELKGAESSIEPGEMNGEEASGSSVFRNFIGFRWPALQGQDDFGLMAKSVLVVADRGLGLLRRFNLDGCEIEDYTEDYTD